MSGSFVPTSKAIAELFSVGLDTWAIGQHFGLHESVVVELLTRHREAERGLHTSFPNKKIPLRLIPYTGTRGAFAERDHV